NHDHQHDASERAKIPKIVQIPWLRIFVQFVSQKCKDGQSMIDPTHNSFSLIFAHRHPFTVPTASGVTSQEPPPTGGPENPGSLVGRSFRTSKLHNNCFHLPFRSRCTTGPFRFARYQLASCPFPRSSTFHLPRRFRPSELHRLIPCP